jgi:hypothetical protein
MKHLDIEYNNKQANRANKIVEKHVKKVLQRVSLAQDQMACDAGTPAELS